jgi:hypothetical protein
MREKNPNAQGYTLAMRRRLLIQALITAPIAAVLGPLVRPMLKDLAWRQVLSVKGKR